MSNKNTPFLNKVLYNVIAEILLQCAITEVLFRHSCMWHEHVKVASQWQSLPHALERL